MAKFHHHFFLLTMQASMNLLADFQCKNGVLQLQDIYITA